MILPAKDAIILDMESAMNILKAIDPSGWNGIWGSETHKRLSKIGVLKDVSELRDIVKEHERVDYGD